MAMKIKKPQAVNSVSEFVDYVMDWTRDGRYPVAFRGQSYHKWATLPRIFRPDVGIYGHEKKIVRDIVSIHPQEFKDDSTMFDRLVRMQHFDLPTRLLDVTMNPLVALFFATGEYRGKGNSLEDGKVQAIFLPENRQKYYDSDLVSCMANLANLTPNEKKEIGSDIDLPAEVFNEQEAAQRLLWFVRQEKPAFSAKIIPSDLKLPVYVQPKMSNRRIIAQAGAFVLYGAKRIRQADKDLRIFKVIIPADKKLEMRESLGRFGIHSATLFPEIDKAADYIVQRYAGDVL